MSYLDGAPRQWYVGPTVYTVVIFLYVPNEIIFAHRWSCNLAHLVKQK